MGFEVIIYHIVRKTSDCEAGICFARYDNEEPKVQSLFCEARCAEAKDIVRKPSDCEAGICFARYDNEEPKVQSLFCEAQCAEAKDIVRTKRLRSRHLFLA